MSNYKFSSIFLYFFFLFDFIIIILRKWLSPSAIFFLSWLFSSLPLRSFFLLNILTLILIILWILGWFTCLSFPVLYRFDLLDIHSHYRCFRWHRLLFTSLTTRSTCWISYRLYRGIFFHFFLKLLFFIVIFFVAFLFCFC